MAVTAHWYGKGLLGQFGAAPVNWTSATIKCALCTSSYSPDQDVHDFYDDLTNEVSSSGTNYTTGGVTLTTPTATYDGASNTVRLDADDVSWTSATFTFRYAIIYKSTGTGSTSPLLGYVDFGGDESVTSGTASIAWDATDGVLRQVAG